MKKSFTTYYTVFCLIVLVAAGASYAEENVRVIEMADGITITFKMASEEIAVQEAAPAKLKRSLPALRIKPKKNVLVYEMGESGLTIFFPATEKEAAEQAENPGWSKVNNTLSNQLEPKVETVELAESGFYIFFPVSRDDNDETKTQFYSQKAK